MAAATRCRTPSFVDGPLTGGILDSIPTHTGGLYGTRPERRSIGQHV